MEKVRIGNDLRVNFSVYRNGEPESFDGASNVVTKLVNEAYNKEITHTHTIADNVVQFDIDALQLTQCGKCRLFISYTKGGDYAVDSPAFELVNYTDQTGGTEVIGVEIVSINISGDIGINRDGLSAYEVWESYPGNEGKTIEQYFTWLRENPTKIDLDGLNSNIRQLKFNTATPVTPTQAGQMAWSDEEKTGVLHNGLHTHPIGKETFFTAKNQSGTLIANGKAVYSIGSTGANATIGLATTADGGIAQRTIGIATMDIASNGFGDVTTFGEVNGINTSGLTEGALVYLGLDGNLTSVEPVAPTPKISLGLCIRSHLTQGRIAVYVRPIARLNKLTDVYAPNLLDGDVLRWNGTALRYEVYNLVNKADLVGGKVPASQLPAYVDDILEYANLAAFPAVGETSKLYVTLDTNLTYRWSGSAYTEVSKSLAIGITSTTAFRGDWGKIAYDHSQLTNSNPHGTTATQIANTPAGTISATTVQAAINELDADRVQLETNLNNLDTEVNEINVNAGINFIPGRIASGSITILVNNNFRYSIIEDINNYELIKATGFLSYNNAFGAFNPILIVDTLGVVIFSAGINSTKDEINTPIDSWYTRTDSGYEININALIVKYNNASKIYLCRYMIDAISWVKTYFGLRYDYNSFKVYTETNLNKFFVLDKSLYEHGVGYVRADNGSGSLANDNYIHQKAYITEHALINYNDGVSTMFGMAFYDKEDNVIETYTQAEASGQTIFAPIGSYIIRATGAEVSLVITYQNPLNNLNVVSKEIEQIDYCRPEIIIPKESVAVVGHEWNMYFSSVVKNMNDTYYIAAAASKNLGTISLTGRCFSNCLRITAQSTEIGDWDVEIWIRNKKTNSEIVYGKMLLHVIPESVLSKTVIFIGDSTTDDAYYPAEIENNLSNGGIVGLGTRSDTVTIDGLPLVSVHEGRAGWSVTDYLTKAFVTDKTNPFFNPNTGVFDFSYYMAQQGYASVDLVSVYLGINGDSSLEATVEGLKVIINSIHEYNINTKILINLLHQPAGQDGAAYKDWYQSANNTSFRHHEMNKLYIEEFDGVINNVFVSGINMNLDCDNDYVTITEPLSARNPVLRTRQNNNVHPNVYGYLKIADIIYNNILYYIMLK